jgi:aminocarboxymuconate-semialdehyde decarboxylase
MGTDLAEMPGSAPRLVIDRADAGRIMCGNTTFRKVTSVLWSVSDRLAEMDRAAVSHQVISAVPVTMEFAAEPGADPAYARAVNDSVERGLRGVEVGTRIGELDLDAAELERFWSTCAAADVCVFVHPVLGGTGVVRRAGQLDHTSAFAAGPSVLGVLEG